MSGDIRVSTIEATFTRPTGTTQYAAGDVICNSTTAPVIMEFSVADQPGGTGVIIGAQLIDSASETLALQSELWLFDTTIAMSNDNAAFTPTDAEMLTYVGKCTFSTRAVGLASGNCAFPMDESKVGFSTTSLVRKLYGVLVARNAYTPIDSEVFTIRLKVLRLGR